MGSGWVADVSLVTFRSGLLHRSIEEVLERMRLKFAPK